MWGNVQGWVISGIMLLATGAMLYVLAMPAQESQALGLVKGAYQPIALPTDPSTLSIPSGTDDCNAGELYRQAIELYLQNPKPYEAGATPQSPGLPGVKLILQAAGCSRMHLFDVNVRQVVNYDDHKPWVDAISSLGQAVTNAGLELRDDDPPSAMKYYHAALLLGERLYEERVAWPELNQGLSIMSAAAEGLAGLARKAGDTSRAKELDGFARQISDYQNQLQLEIASPLGNPVESYSSKFAGDIFAVARNPNAPPVWRIEAILHLGRYRWNVRPERAADQHWAPRELKTLETSPDPRNNEPAVRTAIQAALNLTLEQQQKTGSGP